MNTEKKIEKSEKIASTILRALAIVGLVAVLALVAWSLVRGISYFPTARESLVGAVTSVTSLFTNTEEESLTFSLPSQTFPVNEAVSLAWVYKGEARPDTFTFSYHCGTEATLSVLVEDEWKSIVCGEPVQTTDESVVVIPQNTTARFADMRLTVEGGALIDSTVVSIVNTEIEAVATENTMPTITTTQPIGDTAEDTLDTEQEVQEEEPTVPTVPQYNPPQTISTVVPQYTGPADLVVEIENTGVLVPVDGENVFFPVSPVPSDKVAGVVFTVTNKGGGSTGLWGFRATLPIEGDDEYEYLSPLQIPLASGAQMQFTLGFDEVLESSSGTIRIELLPENKKDNPKNNTDSVSISIKKK